MRVIAGLGNPGREYENNRHNIGFMAIDALYAQGGFSPWRNKFQAELAEGSFGGEKVLLVKPQTYMNNSGQSLAAILQFYKIPLSRLLVIHDELDIAPAKLRVKSGGSSGGHNGIKSIDAHCGREYQRLRLGIGHPGSRELVHHHVMGDFSKAEQIRLAPLLAALGRALPYFISGDMNGLMNKVHIETHDTSGNNGHHAPGKTAKAPAAMPTDKIPAAKAAKPQAKPPAGTMAAALKSLLGGKKPN